jgi:hypothetical protein
MWEEKTGVKPSRGFCGVRYGRLKANLARVKNEDLSTMKTCAAKIGEEIEQEKQKLEEEKRALDKKRWGRISTAMEQAGTQKYEAGTVEKAFKQMIGSTARSSSMAANGEDVDE